MSYSVFLSRKANKQYNSFDQHIQGKIRSILLKLKENPNEGFSLSGEKYVGLRYVKTKHKAVEYRAVYDINDEQKEVLIIFLGTRENFYKELKRYLG